MINFFEKLLSLIYIQSCYFCKSTKEDSLVCSNCYKKIHFLPNSVFRVIENKDVYACCLYDDIIKILIKSLKYKNQKKLAKIQAQIMYDYWKNLNLKENFIILPVPIHKKRLKERKYNHMDIVAKEFSKLTKYKVLNSFLIREKDTQKQYNLHKKDRIKNIQGAFNINQNKKPSVENNFLIIDDITSTGITIEELIKVLTKNGYNNITALTLATPDIWN